MELAHTPVMSREVVDYLTHSPVSVAVDGTAGGGGHTALLGKAFPRGHVLAFERDPERASALAAAFEGSNVTVIPESFVSIPSFLKEHGYPPAMAALFDLGLSSIQLDDPERGFSHGLSGPLDMRFDRSSGEPLGERLRRMTAKDIADVIYRYGEEGRSRSIARAIKTFPSMETTDDLAAAVRTVVKGNPVKPLSRVFQAFRIMVNDELEHLELLLRDMHLWTAPECRIAVITFHSIEDRMIKLHFRDSEHFRQFDPPWLLPGRDEKQRNSRARSARLRLGVRV